MTQAAVLLGAPPEYSIGAKSGFQDFSQQMLECAASKDCHLEMV